MLQVSSLTFFSVSLNHYFLVTTSAIVLLI